ncbi:MAG: protein kinase [Acidobacteriia bacterium]|nr:protein kinase [Terriglobia bacterium]
MTTFVMTNPQTLAERLAEESVLPSEALRYALGLAEALRQIHNAGKVHGALSPSNIAITDAGLELIDAPDQATTTVTPYTAPEILQGRPADARSDIFAFGAIAYEIFTGRRAFEGEDVDTLTTSLTSAVPPPSGNPSLDRLVDNCIARDPAVRCQRIQRVILELKLLAGAARGAEDASSRQRAATALRADMQQLEACMAARLQVDERIISDMQHAAAETVTLLRGQISTVESKIAAAEQNVEVFTQRTTSHVEQNSEATGQRIAGMEQGLDALRHDVAALQENMDARLDDLDQVLTSQKAVIESVRAAQEQTDDMIERVVEALEVLRGNVFDRM